MAREHGNGGKVGRLKRRGVVEVAVEVKWTDSR